MNYYEKSLEKLRGDIELKKKVAVATNQLQDVLNTILTASKNIEENKEFIVHTLCDSVLPLEQFESVNFSQSVQVSKKSESFQFLLHQVFLLLFDLYSYQLKVISTERDIFDNLNLDKDNREKKVLSYLSTIRGPENLQYPKLLGLATTTSNVSKEDEQLLESLLISTKECVKKIHALVVLSSSMYDKTSNLFVAGLSSTIFSALREFVTSYHIQHCHVTSLSESASRELFAIVSPALPSKKECDELDFQPHKYLFENKSDSVVKDILTQYK